MYSPLIRSLSDIESSGSELELEKYMAFIEELSQYIKFEKKYDEYNKIRLYKDLLILTLLLAPYYFIIRGTILVSYHYQARDEKLIERYDCTVDDDHLDADNHTKIKNADKCDQIYEKQKMHCLFIVVVIIVAIGAVMLTAHRCNKIKFTSLIRNRKKLLQSQSIVIAQLNNIIEFDQQKLYSHEASDVKSSPTADVKDLIDSFKVYIFEKLNQEPFCDQLATSQLHPGTTQARCLIYLITLLSQISKEKSVEANTFDQMLIWMMDEIHSMLTPEVLIKKNILLITDGEVNNFKELIESYPLVVVKSILSTLDYLQEIIKATHSYQTNEKFDQIINILTEKLYSKESYLAIYNRLISNDKRMGVLPHGLLFSSTNNIFSCLLSAESLKRLQRNGKHHTDHALLIKNARLAS